MEITVPLTVRVEDWMDIDGFEHAVVVAARQAMAEALTALVTASETLGACPGCGSEQTRWDETRTRVVLASFGRVELRVRRVRCRQCGHRHQPARALLAALGMSTTTQALREAAIWAGSSWPFATAARLLGDFLGAEISPEQVRQLTVATGTQTAADQQAAAQAIVAPSAETVRAERAAVTERTRHGSRTVDAAAAPRRLLIGLDGGWVASRDQHGGMEGKVGVVATGMVAIGSDRHALTPRRYVATFESAAVLGNLTYAAADALGATASREQLVIGDGAEWITHQARQHFPDATRILDWAHLARVMVRAVRAAAPGAANRERRRELYTTVTDALWDGTVDAATATLEALSDPERPCPALEDALRYLASQRDWLGDYGAWRDADYPVGSGMIERAVALVINWRMKNRGMRWLRSSASAIVALRVEQLNRDWDTAMDDMPLAA